MSQYERTPQVTTHKLWGNDNERAIKLYTSHRKAVKRLGWLEESWQTAVTVYDINNRSYESHAAPDAYDANLWQAHQHKEKYFENYVGQAILDAESKGIDIDHKQSQK